MIEATTKLLDFELSLDEIDFFTVALGANEIPSKFLNGVINIGGTGDFFLPVKQGDKIVYFKCEWDPDCDGSFYKASFRSRDCVSAEINEFGDADYFECVNYANIKPLELLKYFVG